MRTIIFLIAILTISNSYAGPDNRRSLTEERMLVKTTKKIHLNAKNNKQLQKANVNKKADRIPSQFLPRDQR